MYVFLPKQLEGEGNNKNVYFYPSNKWLVFINLKIYDLVKAKNRALCVYEKNILSLSKKF